MPEGHSLVAEALSGPAVASAGYVTFHDVPGNGPWNIDHVVVGHGGVFVIEANALAGRRFAIRKSLWLCLTERPFGSHGARIPKSPHKRNGTLNG